MRLSRKKVHRFKIETSAARLADGTDAVATDVNVADHLHFRRFAIFVSRELERVVREFELVGNFEILSYSVVVHHGISAAIFEHVEGSGGVVAWPLDLAAFDGEGNSVDWSGHRHSEENLFSDHLDVGSVNFLGEIVIGEKIGAELESAHSG